MNSIKSISTTEVNSLIPSYLDELNDDEALNRLLTVATTVCGTEMGAISVLEHTRQWFKAKKGIAVKETPIEYAFCAHTVLEDNTMVVEDASVDERFKNNPLVTGSPNIRFYAGSKIKSKDGNPFATICVIDSKKMRLTDEQISILENLAVVASHIMDMKYNSYIVNSLINNVKTLGSMIPVCYKCKHVKTDSGDWVLLEKYIEKEFKAHLSHGVCDECCASLL